MKTRTAWLSACLTMSLPASAMEFDFDNGLTLQLDSTVTWGAQWRVESRDEDITGADYLALLQEMPFLPLTDPEGKTGAEGGLKGTIRFELRYES